MSELVDLDGVEKLAKSLVDEENDPEWGVSRGTTRAAIVALRWMAKELRDRRSRDLTADEVEALRDLMGRVTANYDGTISARQSQHIALLTKLLTRSE